MAEPGGDAAGALRARARTALGADPSATVGSIGEAVWAGGGWAPLGVLAATGGAVLGQVALVLDVDVMAGSVGRASTTVYFLGFLCWATAAVLAVPFMLRFAVARVSRRALLAWGVALLGSGYVGIASFRGLLSLCLAASLAGIGSVVAGAVRGPVLADAYPPAARVRIAAVARAGALLAGAAIAAVVAFLPEATGLSWRAGVGLVGAAVLGLAVLIGRSSDVSIGDQEHDRVGWLVHGGHTADDPVRAPGLAESVRRVLATRSVRPLLAVVFLSGAMSVALPLYGGYALEQIGGASTDVAWLVAVGLAVVGACVLVAVAPRAEAVAATAPRRLAHLLAWALVVGGVAIAVAGWLPLPAQAVVVALAAVVVTIGVGVADALLGAVVPPSLRGTAGVLGFSAAIGGAVGGPNLLASADGTWGIRVAVLLMGLTLAAAARIVRDLGDAVRADHSRMVEELVERAELVRARRRGAEVPLLACRRVSFSYGPLQVLFDVDFAVDDGEMVALLGTNGAGKSTLLKVISGVGLPSRGTVRLRGEDITYAEPGERVRAGISQIPGGKAVFGPLTVADNLRLYGYALGRDRKAVDRGIEQAFATFPRLHERRSSLASTLSGGEQQMLALTKAFILRPQLLLIDELSLGLAPKVVGELLTMVRAINETGTAVVLVEQSVNVALSLAHHAYFMEKGEVRFDGPSAALLDRPDVLRSVFLQGAATGLESS